MRAPTLSPPAAAGYLRGAYALAFLAQCAAAALVGVGVVLLAGGGPNRPNDLLAWALVLLALAQLPVLLFAAFKVGSMKGGPGARQAALKSALLMGALLASSAWFLALALATGQAGAPLYLLLLLTLSAYPVGFILIGRLGQVAASEEFGSPVEP